MGNYILVSFYVAAVVFLLVSAFAMNHYGKKLKFYRELRESDERLLNILVFDRHEDGQVFGDDYRWQWWKRYHDSPSINGKAWVDTWEGEHYQIRMSMPAYLIGNTRVYAEIRSMLLDMHVKAQEYELEVPSIQR